MRTKSGGTNRVGTSAALTLVASVFVTAAIQVPAFADNVVNEKVSVKERGITNDGAQIVVDESESASANGHTSLSTVPAELEADIGVDETGALSVTGYTSVDAEIVGFSCTIESLESGHCESI